MEIKFELSKETTEQYKDLLNDVIKFATILIVLNLLMFFTNPAENSFMGETYFMFMIFILLGVATYWLVISKLVRFD